MLRAHREAFPSLPWWRFKACWYGEAGSFSAAAAHQIQQGFIAWRERQQARATERAATEAVIARQRDAAALKSARDDHRRALAALELRLALLGDEEGA